MRVRRGRRINSGVGGLHRRLLLAVHLEPTFTELSFRR
jgi:hypothetical protein